MPQVQTERDRWKVIIARRNASEVLVSLIEATLALPEVQVPVGERLAGNLNAELQQHWRLNAVSLFPVEVSPPAEEHGTVRYHAAELLRPNEILPKGMHWIPVPALTERLFLERGDFVAILQLLRLPLGEIRSEAPFGHFGWFTEVTTWLEKVLTPSGLNWNGRFRQFHASNSFSLVRFETNSHAVWFKAVGQPNIREFPITEALRQLFPTYLAKIVATRPDWNAWLAEEVEGTPLTDCSRPAQWHSVATSLAELQIQSIGRTWQLLDAGARDLRASSLAALVEPCFEAMNQLMKEQTKASPRALSECELSALSSQIKKALSDLQQLDIPDTLGHLDFNPSNIIVSENRSVFLDWAEAYVGPPFLTYAYLTEHFARTFRQDPAERQKLAATYAKRWFPFVSAERVGEALACAPLLAAFAYLAESRDWKRNEEPRDPSAGFFRSLARRMKREADRLSQRSTEWARSLSCLGLS
jgi:Ser/Thr protein kinase RdoA (MazF antagonist)